MLFVTDCFTIILCHILCPTINKVWAEYLHGWKKEGKKERKKEKAVSACRVHCEIFMFLFERISCLKWINTVDVVWLPLCPGSNTRQLTGRFWVANLQLTNSLTTCSCGAFGVRHVFERLLNVGYTARVQLNKLQ